MSAQLWQRSASELASMIAKDEVSSREVVDAHLDRIETVNPRLNAITVEMADRARDMADAADRATEPRRRLHGVPVTIKENIDLIGYPTTHGVAAFAEAMPPANAPGVERLLAAGAIPIGRTNLPEMALRVATENSLRGRTYNPWNPDITAAGSSGGEGSAIAAGMSPLGLGNDIGGSIRNPALCIGVAGLKPGYGRIPQASSLPPEDPGISAQLMAVEGPLARRIADLSLALEVMAGPHPKDPRVTGVDLQGPPAPRRAGLVRSLAGLPGTAWSDAGLEAAVTALTEAGWELDEVELPDLSVAVEIWVQMLAFDVAADLPLLRQVMGPAEVAVLEGMAQMAGAMSMTPQQVFSERYRLQRSWGALLADYPVVVTPGWLAPPFSHGADIDPDSGLDLLATALPLIVPANSLGLPALAMTTAVHDGLPTGVQIYAGPWREDLCLNAGADIEASCGVFTPIDPIWDAAG